MNPSRNSYLFAAGLVAVSSLAVVDPARAQRGAKSATPPNHDGIYGVQIITEQGACDKFYNWTIAISDGRISSTGDTPMEATGQIDRQGIVSLAFRRFNEVAHVAGQVKGRKGSGTWSSPTMACGGIWRATRQS